MFTINPRNIAELLLREYGELLPTDVNVKEIQLKERIMEVIECVKNSTDNDLVSYTTLDIDPDGEAESKAEDADNSYSVDVEKPSTSRSGVDGVDFDYKKRAVQFWRTPRSNGKKQTLSHVQSNFKRLKNPEVIYRWAKQVDEGGSCDDKWAKIADITLGELNATLAAGGVVHDVDIKRWALDAATQVNHPKFKACHRWIAKFKNKNRIRSRKITKFVSRASFQKREVDLRKKAEDFVKEARSMIQEIGLENVYNADQSGFNLEMSSGRTLQVQGVKKVEVAVQSVNSTTHSYTMQPLISGDGRLVGPLLIVLAEKDGTFGPRVKKNLFKPENTLVLASTSGKCTTNIMETWYREVFLPHTGDKSLLLVDSWGGFKKMTNNVATDKQVAIKYIPEGTTPIAQPWDVFGARVWKNYVRRLSELLKRSDPAIVLHERNNIIKLQSLTHIQFSSPRYSGLFKYSWYASGYANERGERFENPANYGFDSLGTEGCAACEDTPIVRCSWCQDSICSEHFFVKYHNCKLFVP